eukprot:COSAG02_NODE_55300_length_291_cov_0.807292_1_plen_61_part_01
MGSRPFQLISVGSGLEAQLGHELTGKEICPARDVAGTDGSLRFVTLWAGDGWSRFAARLRL